MPFSGKWKEVQIGLVTILSWRVKSNRSQIRMGFPWQRAAAEDTQKDEKLYNKWLNHCFINLWWHTAQHNEITPIKRVFSTERQRLDYVDDHQDVFTSSETYDIEVFQVPSVGLFAAMAHRSTRPGSGIYKWTNGRFQLYQNISTHEAVAWKHFTMGKKVG